jgi:hypothetical protein
MIDICPGPSFARFASRHRKTYAGRVYGAPWQSRYYVYAIDYENG